jgi:DNA replication protein DnaC
MPSDAELARARVPLGRGKCAVCFGLGTFSMWSGVPFLSEPVEYDCSCDEQLILHRWMSVRGLPKQHQRFRWNDVTTVPDSTMRQVGEAWDRLENDIRRGLGVVIHGGHSTGKSMLAFLLARKLMHAGQFDVLCISDADINKLDWKDADEMARWYKRIMPAEVLVFDNLGKETKSAFNDTKVEELFGYRNDNMLATIVTTAFTPDGLRGRHGTTVTDGVEERTVDKKVVPVYAAQTADLIENRCRSIVIPPGTASFEPYESSDRESRMNISRPFTFG